MGDPPQTSPPKFWTFKPLRARWIKFSELVDVKNKLNVTKIGGATMGVFPKLAHQNSHFLTFQVTHKIFKIIKYKGTIKFGCAKIQTFQPLTQDTWNF